MSNSATFGEILAIAVQSAKEAAQRKAHEQMSNVTDINAKRPPVHYTVRIIHHWDGFIEFRIEDVADDPRSRASVLNMMQRVSGIQEAADAMHAYILARINSLMNTTDAQELKTLAELADLAQAYEEKRFPLV